MGFPWFERKNYQIRENLAIALQDLDMIGAV
jgi:hypothetical protein